MVLVSLSTCCPYRHLLRACFGGGHTWRLHSAALNHHMWLCPLFSVSVLCTKDIR